MRKGGNKMRAKYSVTHYETYNKTVLDVLDEFLRWLYSRGISDPEDVGEILGVSAYKARKLQRLEDLPDKKIKKMMVRVMKDG